MSNCVTLCPAPAPCQCTESQTCVLVGRSCDSCGQNVCQDNPSKHKGTSPGATAGQAIGGMLAGLLVAFLVYKFWFKRQRSKARGSGQRVRFGDDTKPDSGHAPGRRSRMMSRQLGQEEKMILSEEIASARKRNTLLHSPHPTPEAELNPFADAQEIALTVTNADERVQSTSTQNSDFSFRSSTSTTNIPIAYIPAHSNSMSLEDGMERGALGEKRKSLLPLPGKRNTINSIGQGSDSAQEVLQSSLKVPSGDRPPRGDKPPKPSRPAREGLDLKLPKVAGTSSPSGFGLSPGAASASPSSDNRPLSGFPWSAAPPASPGSLRSVDSNASSLAVPGNSPASRPDSSASVDTNHLSVISHMSYLLDPPKIMTAHQTARVEVVGPAQARTVQLTNPRNTPASTQNPNTPVTPSSQEHIASLPPSDRQSMDDPFADQVSHVVGGFGFNQPITTPTFGGMVPIMEADRLAYERSSIGSTDSRNFASDIGNATRASVATDDISIFTGSSRPATEMRYRSGVSSNHDSILDGMPFMALSASQGQPSTPQVAPSSPNFPTPPPRSPALDRASIGSDPFSDQGKYSDAATHGENSPRSMHFASTDDRYSQISRASSAGVSMRSGYSSVLENIPFQLGFPGNDRGSMWSEGSDSRSSRRISEAGSMQDGQYSTSEPVPPIPAQHRRSQQEQPPASPLAQEAFVPDSASETAEQLQTPKMEQGEQAVQETPKPAASSSAAKAADARASVDSFLESAMLANSFQELQDSADRV